MKHFLVFLLLLHITAALFAVGQQEHRMPHTGQEIRVLLANHPYGELIRSRIPEFEMQTGIRVLVESLNEVQLSQRLINEFSAGTAAVDVFMTRPMEETLLFNRNGWYAPLHNFDFSDFPANTVYVGRKNGIPHIVPIIIEWQVLYYRRDLMARAGIRAPTTFEELERAAMLLDSDEVFGFGSRGAGSLAVTQVSTFLHNFGARYIYNNTAVFNTPQALEAFRLYGWLLGIYGPGAVTAMSWSQLMPIFQAGRLAMWTDSSAFYVPLTNPLNTRIPIANIGVARMPAGPGGSNPFIIPSWAMAISYRTRNKDAAMMFLNWATSREFAVMGMGAGINMARRSVWTDPVVTARINPGLVDSMLHASQYGYSFDRPFITSANRAMGYIGELIIESINTRGTSPRLQAMATERVNAVNNLLMADGEFGRR